MRQPTLYTATDGKRGVWWPDRLGGNPTQEQYAAALAEAEALLQSDKLAARLAALWKAATDYQESFISGAAYGLVTLGVIQQKPKSLAVMAWINSIWSGQYYPRKAQLQAGNEVSVDFSVCGEMPYSIPELTAEVLQQH